MYIYHQDLLRSAKLSAFETKLLNYGISTIQQLTDDSSNILTDEVLLGSEIGMKPVQVKKLRRAIQQLQFSKDMK
jgi:hypothetical protein